MRVFRSIKGLTAFIGDSKKKGFTIGLVPTMGALHRGHLELLRKSKLQNDITLCTIYVNPAQFNSKKDLQKYPREESSDLKVLKNHKCEVVFIPKDREMYPSSPELRIDFGKLETILEGFYRPGHFTGVGLIVSKIFNIIRPTRAYFGLKDLQQCLVIEKLVNELSYPIKLVFIPTARESSGLALSSRNALLSADDLEIAPNIYSTLKKAKTMIRNGEPVPKSLRFARKSLSAYKRIKIEYLEILNMNKGVTARQIKGKNRYAICIAAYLNGVRLIDNIII